MPGTALFLQHRHDGFSFFHPKRKKEYDHDCDNRFASPLSYRRRGE